MLAPCSPCPPALAGGEKKKLPLAYAFAIFATFCEKSYTRFAQVNKVNKGKGSAKLRFLRYLLFKFSFLPSFFVRFEVFCGYPLHFLFFSRPFAHFVGKNLPFWWLNREWTLIHAN